MKFEVVELGDTLYAKVKRKNGTDIGDVDIFARDVDTGKIYAIQCTIGTGRLIDKIDTFANVIEELRKRGHLVEPIIMVRDRAAESKRNVRRIKILDRDDIYRILKLIRERKISAAKRIIQDPVPI